MTPPVKKKSRFWRKCRIYFRRARITVWLVTLFVLGILIYLNQVGLPDFVKRPLLAKLQERGVALEFTRLRMHWVRGFVAEQVRFGAGAGQEAAAVPRLTAQEVELNIGLRALLRGRIQVDAIMLRGGKLEWHLATNEITAAPLQVDNIESRLRFLPGDQWELEDLRGQFAGAKFFLRGSLTNASAMQEWQFTRGDRPVNQQRAADQLRQLADVLERIKFSTPPELRLNVYGDARDLGTFNAWLSLKANDAETPWGTAHETLLMAQMFAATSNELSRAEITLQARDAETPWAATTNLDLKIRLVTYVPQPELVVAAVTLRVDQALTPWANVGETQLKANWVHAVTNPIPRTGRIELYTAAVDTFFTRARNCDFAANWSSSTNAPVADPALGFWNFLLPYEVKWNAAVGAVRSLGVVADDVVVAGAWLPPELSLTELRAKLYDGTVAGSGRVDVISRDASATLQSNFEIKKIVPLLPRAAQEWLAKLTWAQPPQLRGDLAVKLPAWTNQTVDWQAEVRPTLRLAGAVALTNGTYRGIHADWATADIAYTNLMWYLPAVNVGRPEGGMQLSLTSSDATRQYHFRLRSAIDPQAILPLFDAEVRRGFELCEFGQPPVVQGEMWGRWYAPETIGFRGQLALTNFSLRGQHADALVTALTYTNLTITVLEPKLWTGTQYGAAEGITVDLNAMRTYITNAAGQIAPSMVVRAIGPVVTRVMEPYHFGEPPVARVNGYISMRDPQDADIVFEGTGRDFESLKFRATEYSARVHWQNEFLTITNVFGKFYDGDASAWARFVFNEDHDATYAFSINTTNSDLGNLLADVTGRTNRQVEGRLTGGLTITNATTQGDTMASWEGDIRARLRDGLLWELPIFGVMSRPLESVLPGVANSKFTEAMGTGVIRAGRVRSRDLEMRAPALRLQYRGSVGFDQTIDARVIAEPLRDTPVVGNVLSTILAPLAKLFAYKITGTLSEPVTEPYYIPSPLMIPLSPFETLGKIFSAPVAPSTNAPPEIK
jgi:hypothetical protein